MTMPVTKPLAASKVARAVAPAPPPPVICTYGSPMYPAPLPVSAMPLTPLPVGALSALVMETPKPLVSMVAPVDQRDERRRVCLQRFLRLVDFPEQIAQLLAAELVDQVQLVMRLLRNRLNLVLAQNIRLKQNAAPNPQAGQRASGAVENQRRASRAARHGEKLTVLVLS